MALVTFADGIDTVHGALDSVKEGQRKRARSFGVSLFGTILLSEQ